MKQASTLFLKVVIFLIGIAVLAFYTVALPIAISGELKGDFDYLPFLIGLYAPGIPFFIALAQGMKLLSYISKGKAFSELSTQALKKIKYSALTISGLFTAGMPYIFYLGDQDDAPGIVLMGLVLIGAALVIATFAAVLQRLLEEAIKIKSENELTV